MSRNEKILLWHITRFGRDKDFLDGYQTRRPAAARACGLERLEDLES